VISIDLNSDLGEGAGTDARLMPLITSASIACGAHAGDGNTMRDAVALAVTHGVAIGAHPGYPDRENFGRIPLDMEAKALIDEIARQIGLLRTIVDASGAKLRHVKAHGALYNQAERDLNIAEAIAIAVSQDRQRTGERVVVFAPPGSAMLQRARAAGLPVAREGFIDRAYEPNGTLRSRRLPGALHTDPKVAAAQALSLVRDGGVRTFDGSFLELEVDTLCLHGDTPGAPEIASQVRRVLAEAGVQVRPLAWS
jgi:UPF0271 protein